VIPGALVFALVLLVWASDRYDGGDE